MRSKSISKAEAEELRTAIQNFQKDPNNTDFTTIYNTTHERATRVAYRLLRNDADTADAVQDSFLQLYKKLHTFRGTSQFSTWFHRLVVNVCLMRLRKKDAIRNARSIDEPIMNARNGEQPFEIAHTDLLLAGAHLRPDIERAIKELSLGQQVMFVLHDVKGYGHKAIAEMLGCSVGNSKSQCFKARQSMKRLLAGEQIIKGQGLKPKFTTSTSPMARAAAATI